MKNFSRVLVTGARGQLARALLSSAPRGVECVGMERAALDIGNAAAVKNALRETRAQFVINGAAYNLVDKAEGEGAEAARQINFRGAENLAQVCARREVPLLHFSTDFVFDGAKKTPYLETDATNPLGVYAQSKLDGERAVLAASPRNFVVRVCRLFGPREYSQGENANAKPAGSFPFLMLKLAQTRNVVRVVNDQIGTPSYNPDVARGVWQLIEKAEGGLFHLSNYGAVSFADYARETFRIAGVSCKVEEVSSEEYGAPAARPPYSVLSNEKIIAAGVSPLRDWREALAEAVLAG